MLDIQLLRKDTTAVAERLKTRGFDFDVDGFNALESQRKTIQMRTEELQSQRNKLSKEIGILKSKKQDADDVMAQVAGIGDELKASAVTFEEIQVKLNDLLMRIPNLPHESVPQGKDETENVEISRWGGPATYDFEVKDHVAIGEDLGMLDFDTAAKLAGARFSFMRGGLAKLHRALAQLMLDTQTEVHGYTECYTPYIVNADSMLGTGQLPKFKEDLFWVIWNGVSYSFCKGNF